MMMLEWPYLMLERQHLMLKWTNLSIIRASLMLPIAPE